MYPAHETGSTRHGRHAEHILLASSEDELHQAVRGDFEQAGFDVVRTSDGATALRVVRAEPIDLVLLDLVLPDMPGTEVCRRLRGARETAAVPVVLLAAQGEEADRVIAFELGADDYVVKPFSVRELILRVRAILRRARRTAKVEERFTFGKLEVDRAAHRTWVEGEEVMLSALELRLLAMLYDRRGRVLSRDLLLHEVWGADADMAIRNVDTHVRRVRDKLGAAGEYIETVRGAGYRFRDGPTPH